MTHVGAETKILNTSADLRSCLLNVGKQVHFTPPHVLFHEDQGNSGVFLLLKGRARMSVKGLPKLDRVFSAGAILGLPSSFTGHPYSLTAEAVTELDVVHVGQEEFLQLMREHPELCRETTEILGREVTFIQAALAERRKQASSRKAFYDEVVNS